jgi:hypothetical protein
MARHTVPLPDDHTQKLIALFETLGIPTEKVIANPGIDFDTEYLRITPTYVWKIESLTDQQMTAFEQAFNVRIVR